MDRSAIKALFKRGMSKAEIASHMGCSRRTVRRILLEPTDKRYDGKPSGSQVDVFRQDIFRWLDQGIPVLRMLEMAREDPHHPYTGGKTVFYDRVKKFRQDWQKSGQEAWVRFEGLPAEYVQVDWGEVRNFPFLIQEPVTRYFFCARLKYSRFNYVEFTDNMREETLIRCLIRAFESFGGVPWVCVFDNMKTVTLGRDEKKNPIWNETFLKFAVEMEFHPEVCHPYSGNQKGTVENLVKWVKGNFLPGRVFTDDGDLASQLRDWLTRKNSSKSQAHGRVPAELLEVEREKFTPLRTDSSAYGLQGEVVVGPQSLVNVDGNRYSVPVGCIGRTLTVRLREKKVDFYDGLEFMAGHLRAVNRKRPVLIPEHFEPALEKKPRGRVMLYREYLMEQDPDMEKYITELCRRNKGRFNSHILRMYELFKEFGSNELGCACAIASEHGAYGVDYLVSLLREPSNVSAAVSIEVAGAPGQEEIDRVLSFYEDFAMGGKCNG